MAINIPILEAVFPNEVAILFPTDWAIKDDASVVDIPFDCANCNKLVSGVNTLTRIAANNKARTGCSFNHRMHITMAETPNSKRKSGSITYD